MISVNPWTMRIAAVLFAGICLAASGRDACPALLAGNGEAVQPFVCEGTRGETFSLDSLLGERPFLVLTFWGLQCAPCRKEIERLNHLWQQDPFRGKTGMIAVNTDGIGKAQLAREMQERGLEIAFPVVVDESRSLTDRFVNGMIPLTVLIGSDRRVRFSILGVSRGDLDLLERTVIGEETGAMER